MGQSLGMRMESDIITAGPVLQSPLALPAFRRVLVSNMVSATGNGMAPIALAFAVLQIGGSPLSLAAVLAANSIPTIVFLVAGGVYADRWSRSSIIFVSNLGLGAAQRGRGVCRTPGFRKHSFDHRCCRRFGNLLGL